MIKNNFIKQFKLDIEMHIQLTTKHSYDLIINSAIESSNNLAKVLNNFLVK